MYVFVCTNLYVLFACGMQRKEMEEEQSNKEINVQSYGTGIT